MFLHHSSFTNRPPVDATFLPKNFNLNSLRTSGWYAPIDSVQNGPENFKLYQLFVVAPNPDVYTTQLAFGVAYQVVSPHTTDGDNTIVDDEVIEDVHGNAVYTNRRTTVDFDGDGKPDTPVNSVYADVNGEKFNILRLVTNGKVSHEVTGNEADDDIPNDELLSGSNNDNNNSSDDNNSDDNNSDDVQANDIVEDTPTLVVTNRSAVYMRSYVNGSWTAWTTFNASSSSSSSSSSTPGTSDPINTEKIYSYIDKKLTFLSTKPGTEMYGLLVEVTGVYNEAPYDPTYNVYGVQASGIEYNGLGDFPETGDPQKLYIAKSENRLYRWDEASASYFCVGSNYDEIAVIDSDWGSIQPNATTDDDENLDDPELNPSDPNDANSSDPSDPANSSDSSNLSDPQEP